MVARSFRATHLADPLAYIPPLAQGSSVLLDDEIPF
jgi:hypothetical protein